MRSLLNCNGYKRARHSLALLLVLTAGLPFQLNAQQGFNYFEKRIDLTGGYDAALNVLNINQGYCIGVVTQDTVYHHYWQIAFALTDTLGELYQIKQYGDSGDNYMIGNPGALIKFNENRNYAVGNILTFLPDNQINNRALIMCLDTNFDTLWTKRFVETVMPYDTQSVIFQIKRCYDNTLINAGVVMGNTYIRNTPSRVWLLKTDSLGNKLWERFYGEGEEYFQGHSVIQTNDGGYVIGAVKFTIGYGGTVDPLIIKTDSLGNEEWTINPGNPYVDDHKVMVALASDGNIIAGTNYGTVQHGDNREAVVKIMKISPDGTVLWDNNYLEPQYDNYLLNTIVLNNGNIIVNGARDTHGLGEDYPAETGWILCTDSLGNQLWYKEYALLTAHNSFNDLYDVRETPDGGLIGCGMVNPTLPDTGTNDIWLMKMDSMGCLWEGCDTTVIINNTVTGIRGFMLYPVPATNRLTVKLPEEAEKGTLFTVYNMLGLKAKSVTIPYRSRTKTLDIAGLPSGVYLGVLSVNGKVTGKRKFIIRR